jgi:hypothetical protein
MGFAWTLRGLGWSTIPTRSAKDRIKEVKISEATTAMLKETKVLWTMAGQLTRLRFTSVLYSRPYLYGG